MRVVLAVVTAVVVLGAGALVAWRVLGAPGTTAHIRAAAGGAVTTDAGVVVRFAPGALTADADVRVAPAGKHPEPPPGTAWAAEPVDISLRGGALRTAATVTLPLPAGRAAAGVTVVSRGADGTWTAEGGTADARSVTTVAGHFSWWGAVTSLVDVVKMPGTVGKTLYDAFRDVRYQAPAPRCDPASQLWTATTRGDNVKVCVTAGGPGTPARLRVVNNRLYGQFLQLRGYPAMRVTQLDRAGLVPNVWRMIGETNRDYTFLPGKGTLELDLPPDFRLIDFVARPGLESVIMQIVVDTAGVVRAPLDLTVKAVQCVLALPVLDEVARDRAYRRLGELAGAIANCITAAWRGYRLLKPGAPPDEEAKAKQARDSYVSAWSTAMKDLPTAVETIVQGGLIQRAGTQHVIAERRPIVPGHALNEEGTPLPAPVAATQKRLHDAAAAYRQDRSLLTGLVPRAGLTFGNAADPGQPPSLTLGQEPDPIAGPAAATALLLLTTAPPLHWRCPESGRDAYVYGLADPELDTYPGRLAAQGFGAEAAGLIREATRAARPYRICIDPDGTWSVFSQRMGPAFPEADALRIEERKTEYDSDCRPAVVSAFVPADALCHGSTRIDMNGDGRKDALLFYRRGVNDWTARVVLTAGPVADVVLSMDEDPYEPFNPAIASHADFDGEPGEEVAVTVQFGAHSQVMVLISLAGDRLVLVRHERGPDATLFREDSSIAYGEGVGCADVDSDGRPELLEGGVTFDRDPDSGDVRSAEGGWTAFSWRGKTLVELRSAHRTLTPGEAARPPYQGIAC